MTEEAATRAVALVERLFAILLECRALVPQLERGPDGETASAEAERLLYFALAGAIEAGLVRTAEDTLTVLRHVSAPAGADGRGVAEAAGAGSVTRGAVAAVPAWSRPRHVAAAGAPQECCRPRPRAGRHGARRAGGWGWRDAADPRYGGPKRRSVFTL